MENYHPDKFGWKTFEPTQAHDHIVPSILRFLPLEF
jgi:hypothetical protein